MKTVAVQMTARGRGAIAVVMIAGTDACAVLEQILPSGGAKLRSLKVGAMTRANVRIETADTGATDDALIVRMDQEKYELHLHGGPAVVAGALAALSQAGAEVIDGGRALELGLLGNVIAGEILLHAERAITDSGLQLLSSQTESGLQAWASRWATWLADPANTGRTWEFHSAVQWVLERSQSFDFLLRPARIAIVGAPNVGKSTLANALLGRPVSITSDLAGTTRDWVDALATFTISNTLQVPVLLVDTAGVRTTADAIETESIVRTHQQARAADVVLMVLDATRPPTPEELSLLAAYGNGALVVAINKSDQRATWEPKHTFPTAVPVSALQHSGLELLMAAVLESLEIGSLKSNNQNAEAWAFTARQKQLLERAGIADATSAAALLRELLGDAP